MTAQLSGGQNGPTDGFERIVVALPGRAIITGHRLGRGITVQARFFVVGVAHPRRGPFREDRLQTGTGLRIQPSTEFAHPIALLTIDPQVTPPRPIGIRKFAVLIQQDRQPVGGLA